MLKQWQNHPVVEGARYLICWTIFAAICGAAGGLIGGAFGWCIRFVTGFRTDQPWMVVFLPFFGLIIVWLYIVTGEEKNRGTNMVLASISANDKVTKPTGPLIFVSAVLSHLGGASVGREGAALQLGGWLGARLGELFKLDEKHVRSAIMCGMAAVFAALFGTPVAAAVFCIEVISVGVFYYAALVPCVFSAFIGTGVSRLMGAEAERWTILSVPEMDLKNLLWTILLGLFCAILAVILVVVLHGAEKKAKMLLPNPYIRVVVAGLLFAVLTFSLGSLRYTGSGTQIISEAMREEVIPAAFAWKLLFTAIAIAGGFRGGEIVPTLSIGAAFGALFGSLTGLPVSLSAACGMIALFAGATNCPIASLLIAMEMFHGQGLSYFAITVALSFVLSGYYSLYGTQRFAYSKLKLEKMDTREHGIE